MPPVPPVQPHIPPTQPIVSPTQPFQPGPMPQLHCSHFKPEFAGKLDEDMDAHLLRTNGWIGFPEGVKVQHFYLTLLGETRLWYESLRPIKVDCIALQNQFHQQYSKISNTREQLFHAWRLFHFNGNTETLDS